MSDSRPAPTRTVSLGAIDPAGSRQLGRRSAVCHADDSVVAGLHDGTLVAVDQESGVRQWRHEDDGGSVVSLSPWKDGILAGERGRDGMIRLHDAETGAVRWRYRSADDVGEPRKETRFFLPFVVDVAVPTNDGEAGSAGGGDGSDGSDGSDADDERTDDRAYTIVRRYERGSDGGQTFRSAVYAFEPDGAVRWGHETDASPISLSVRDSRVAVAFNRCPGSDRDGLRVLDAADGTVLGWWDPPGDGDRRVGDVSLTADGIAVASHADYRGYLLDGVSDGDDDPVRWRVDFGRPVDRGDETVYTYPNHVHATPAGVVFVTGNTYPVEGRETEHRHPNEHTAVGIRPDGVREWDAGVGGFAHEIGSAGDAVVVPVAQHFRERDPENHGVRRFDVGDGIVTSWSLDGVGVAATVADDDPGAVAFVEEPVAYHDDGNRRGAYRLHVTRTVDD